MGQPSRSDNVSHNETVQAEFTRQADAFRASPSLNADAVTRRVAEALGPRVDRALDLACGPGILLPALAARARAVVGVDLTARNLALARAVGTQGVHLVQALAEHLPFGAGTFDAVVIRLVLHHVVQPDAVLAAARALLPAGGRLVVLDALAPEHRAHVELRDAVERLRDPSHTALLSRKAMVSRLRRAGFSLRAETLWSQPRAFSEWARVMHAPRRMADLERVLRALCRPGGDPAGLGLREEASGLWLTYRWGLFVADAA